MEWKDAIRKDERVWEIPARWLHMHYYEALTILFRFENSLRVFVFAVLKNQLFDAWQEAVVSQEGGGQSTISSISKKRIAQAKKFGYLGYEINSPIMHLTSGELVELMTSEKYWEHFKPFFRGAKEIIKNKLLEIGSIRNAIAHFRPVKPDDVSVVKQNAKHTMMEIETCLHHLVSFPQVVPTNTDEVWYKKLAPIGSDQISFELRQSDDSDWICVSLEYDMKIVRTRKWYEGYLVYKILNLKSQAVLTEFPSISKHITYLSERIPYTPMTDDHKPAFRKKLNFLFSRKALVDNHVQISGDFEKLVLKVKEESELVEQDNLARGIFIFTAETHAIQRDHEGRKFWTINSSSLACEGCPDDPTEYWGNSLDNTQDIVSAVSRYPWMPTDISDPEFPF